MQRILKSFFKYGPGVLVFIFLQHSKFQRFVCTMTIIFHVAQYAVITVNLKKCVPKQQVTTIFSLYSGGEPYFNIAQL